MSVASEIAAVPVVALDGAEVSVPQGCDDGGPVGPNSRIADSVAELVPVGVSEIISGAEERSADEGCTEGPWDGTEPLAGDEAGVDEALGVDRLWPDEGGTFVKEPPGA